MTDVDDKSAGNAGARDESGPNTPESASERDPVQGAAALSKGLSVLEVIGEQATPPRFRDLLALTGLPKGTLARILNTLVSFRLVRHEPSDSSYRLGHRLFELAHHVWESMDLRMEAAPVLNRLAEDTSETVALCKLDGSEVLYIDQRSGPRSFGFRVEVGRRAPVHCTAPGKALLAFAPPDEQRELLDRLVLTKYTGRTITSRDRLLAELAIIRARGYATSESEHVSGVASAAAPLFDHTGRAVAAIGVFGPAERMPGEVLDVAGRDLMAASRQISGNVGAAQMNITSNTRSRRSADPEAECVLPWNAQLAEGPVWQAGEKRLYWIDILAPAIHRFNPATRQNEAAAMPKLVSAIVPVEGGGLVALTPDGAELVDFAAGTLKPLVDPEVDLPDNRFNDAKCDALGRLWAGTMRLDASRNTGSLYLINPDLTWERKATGFTVANGLDWSPDNRTLYFVDSATGRIYAYDFDLAGGNISNRRDFAVIHPDDGRPDGLTVDAEGFVWCALWDGWCVRRYAPDGRLDRELRLPVPRPSSVAFGGEGLRTLFVTTARLRLPSRILNEAPNSGGIFAVETQVPGREPKRFRLDRNLL